MNQRLFSNYVIRAITISLVSTAVLALVLPLSGGCAEAPASNTFTELLSLVPATEAANDEFSFLTLINYALTFEDIGISFTSFEDLMDKIRADDRNLLMLLPQSEGSDITGWGRYAERSTIRKEYVGYNLADVDAEIQFGTNPNNGVAAIGKFSPSATSNALGNQDEWPLEIKERYRKEEYNGVTIHNWGDGLQVNLATRLAPPHIDHLGRAMPLAVTDKYLFYHPSLDTVKHMVDASLNKSGSMMDLPEYAAIAERLGGYNIHEAIIGKAAVANNCLYFIDEDFPGLRETEKTRMIENLGTPIKKFLTFGSGSGKDEKGIFNAIVVYHENSAIARENVPLFRQHIENDMSLGLGKTWSEFFTETEIKAEGKLLLVKLYGPSASFYSSWIYSQDNLLYHEE